MESLLEMETYSNSLNFLIASRHRSFSMSTTSTVYGRDVQSATGGQLRPSDQRLMALRLLAVYFYNFNNFTHLNVNILVSDWTGTKVLD